MSTYKLVCPSCYGPLRIRTSEGQTPCFRSLYYQCMSVVCGATFTGTQTIDFQLSPSGVEQPLTILPIAPYVARQKAIRDSRADTNQPDLLDQLDVETASV